VENCGYCTERNCITLPSDGTNIKYIQNFGRKPHKRRALATPRRWIITLKLMGVEK
jgi:hypothetical protein